MLPSVRLSAASEHGLSMNYTTDFKSIRGEVSAQEWQARVDLAACYRLVDKYGMTDLIYNHITARMPGSNDHLLINLYGMLYKEITASSLVKIDVEGEIIWKPEADYGINKSGYVIHGAIHKARPDVACVLHTHTRAGIAVSAMKCGLLPLSQTAIRFVGHIGYHDYEGPAVDLDERERIVSDLGPHDALVMRNHGLLTCGATIQQAFNTMYQLELSCRSQVDAMAARSELVMPGENVLTSPARAGLMACWNGPRCCACSRPRTATRAIRRIGIEISLDQAGSGAGRDRVAAARHRCGRRRLAGPLRRLRPRSLPLLRQRARPA
jgi:ribulose-5-phosphate 4-epimerase/fuculose-1-phosphate aldolase